MSDPTSIGYDVETWGIALLRSVVAVPTDFEVLHEMDVARGDSNRVILSGIETAESWEGPGNMETPLSTVQLTVELRMTEVDASKIETYFAKIQRAFRARPYPDLPEDALFNVRIPLPEGSEEKDPRHNTRVRTCSFSFLAMQIGPVVTA